jgi:hypothetical protein
MATLERAVQHLAETGQQVTEPHEKEGTGNMDHGQMRNLLRH